MVCEHGQVSCSICDIRDLRVPPRPTEQEMASLPVLDLDAFEASFADEIGTKFTPGPWVVDVFYDGLCVKTESGVDIFAFAGSDSEGEPWWEQVKADATLCAAAPEMYAVLCMAFRELRKWYNGDFSDVISRTDAIMPIRAVLNKATGRP